MDVKAKFGEKIKELRLKKGLSQEQLALIAEVDRTYIPDIEKGRRNVSLVVIYKLAQALQVNIKDFFD
ncbi:helix-turn-helix domain-containing protein [Flavobacterium selenitireducens]|uniref:helix-turn-helix domain-containing protein n=1 Tax=Flavobacterium selenitireducens TaxID=2722704 RepID=UPI00168A90C1|nr:helix-turn-helix transcriptional regulator [Flavobacterium selenitireducens]MBD3581713.1 helix-turn-helix transcriptional regulator [Flavobacterium selenitireducens]